MIQEVTNTTWVKEEAHKVIRTNNKMSFAHLMSFARKVDFDLQDPNGPMKDPVRHLLYSKILSLSQLLI